MLTRRGILGAAAVAALSGCGQAARTTSSTDVTQTGETLEAAAGTPSLRVDVMAHGLVIPWGLGFVGSDVVFAERPGRLNLLHGTTLRRISADLADVRNHGEGGLTGLAVSPHFASDRRIVVVFNSTHGDIRVVPFRLSADLRHATRLAPLVTGIPQNTSGRHSGCRLRFGPDGMLWIGTGDTAHPTVAQDPHSLGGKVLRVNPLTGKAPADNPWVHDANAHRRLIWSLGHRNVQGLALQPGPWRMYSVEHGTYRDDEVNLLRRGANYGWDPVGNGYDESRPMTDPRVRGARPAVWHSGNPTVATSGATFVTGSTRWGAYRGNLMVACLKGQRLLAMPVRRDGSIGTVHRVPELDGHFGRLRTVEHGPDGSLWVTTSNGTNDKVLRVRPR